MKPITREWIEKAENSFAVAQLLIKLPAPKNDIICFHSHQCAEMYLKACLQEANTSFPKTHDLSKLLDLLLSSDSAWKAIELPTKALTSCSVEYRYPGSSASDARARKALNDCYQIRQFIQQHLELEMTEENDESI